MSHSHRHNKYGKAFAIGITLNVVYVAFEVFYGLRIDSSALLADAGHNFSDVVSLALAWLATWLAGRRPTVRHTYGLRKTTILASLVNGLLILGASGFILNDAIQKIQEPVEVPGTTLMIVAGVGVLINTGTALLFMKGRKKDLNIRGAFLHMAADAAVSVGVVAGGLVIIYTGSYWVDPALSFLILAVILYSVWGLLAEATELVMDAVPRDIDLEEVRSFLESLEGVEEVHDLHIWALSTTETALTVHLVMPGGCEDRYLFEIRDLLREEFGIDHSTIQLESTFEDEEYRERKV